MTTITTRLGGSDFFPCPQAGALAATKHHHQRNTVTLKRRILASSQRGCADPFVKKL